MSDQYIIDGLSPFPKKWQCADGGNLRVMTEPVQGWIMVRRPKCIPFVMRVPELLNSEPHHLGPFTLLSKGR